MQDGVCKKTIDRHASVESLTWFPGGEGGFSLIIWGSTIKPSIAFISVEGSSVTKLVSSSSDKLLFSQFWDPTNIQDLIGNVSYSFCSSALCHHSHLNIKVLDQYHFGRMKLHDVAVTPDSLRLVGVGPLLESPTGLQPKKSRPEKRLVGRWTL